LQHDTRQIEVRRYYDAVVQALMAGKDVVISSGYNDETVTLTKSRGFAMGFTDKQTAEAVAAAMGDLCRQIAANTQLSGMVLTGGDIALSCCRLLSATGFRVMEEVAPGIPLGRLKGGPWDGLRIVTKAGAFGEEDALCKAVDCLKLFKPKTI
jgi:D-threonate/D-erythronate kinase